MTNYLFSREGISLIIKLSRYTVISQWEDCICNQKAVWWIWMWWVDLNLVIYEDCYLCPWIYLVVEWMFNEENLWFKNFFYLVTCISWFGNSVFSGTSFHDQKQYPFDSDCEDSDCKKLKIYFQLQLKFSIY